jgi:hypothetical protein
LAHASAEAVASKNVAAAGVKAAAMQYDFMDTLLEANDH